MKLTSGEAAAVLGIRGDHLRKLVQRGRITPVQPGARPLEFWAKDVYDLQVLMRTPSQVAEHDALWAEFDRVLAGQT